MASTSPACLVNLYKPNKITSDKDNECRHNPAGLEASKHYDLELSMHTDHERMFVEADVARHTQDHARDGTQPQTP